MGVWVAGAEGVAGVGEPLVQARNNVIPTIKIAVNEPEGLSIHINYAELATIDAKAAPELFEGVRCRTASTGARPGSPAI